jgi:hypothetical protein
MYPCHRSDEHSPRRHIDVAIGVLIGLRHCSEQQAFADIAAAVHETGIGLRGVSYALTTLAGGGNDARADPTALRHWRAVLGERPHAAA